jgi:hypothetical protein
MTLRIWFKGKTIFLLSCADGLDDFLETMFYIKQIHDRSMDYIVCLLVYEQERRNPENFIEFHKENNIRAFDSFFELQQEYPRIWDKFFREISSTSLLFEFHREKDIVEMIKWLLKIHFFSKNDLFSIYRLEPISGDVLPLLLAISKELRFYQWRYFLFYFFLKIRVYFLFLPYFLANWIKINLGLWAYNIYSALPFTILLYLAFIGYFQATMILFFWITWRFFKYLLRFIWSFYQAYFLPWEERMHFVLQLPFSHYLRYIF